MWRHMNQLSGRAPIVAVMLCVAAFCAGQPSSAIAAPATCDLQSASVTNVYRKPATDTKLKDGEAITTVELGDVIWVEVMGLAAVTACEASGKSEALKSELATAQSNADKAAAGTPKAEALKAVKAVQLRLDVAESNRLKLLNQSESFFKDIVSDANGVSFHRFQMVAWTIVLAIIFGKETFSTLAMPDFDNTLIGLMGLSAATYVGLKTTEATVPKK
jgi:hypothetical protein